MAQLQQSSQKKNSKYVIKKKKNLKWASTLTWSFFILFFSLLIEEALLRKNKENISKPNLINEREGECLYYNKKEDFESKQTWLKYEQVNLLLS